MSLVFASICPHPPILIPTIGGNDVKKISRTVLALEKLNKIFVQTRPKTIVVISPHAPTLPQTFAITNVDLLSGNFRQFGDFKTELFFKSDRKLAYAILQKVKKANIPLEDLDYKDLDHGTLVPLYYLTKNISDVKLSVVSFCFLDFKTHFQFGQILGKVIQKQKEKIAVVASGDLSHRLTLEAPAGYHPQGKQFDKKIVDLLKRDPNEILNIKPDFAEKAGECGLRSIIILLGILDSLKYKCQVLSYEGPFGVGYLVANFNLV